MARKQSPHFPSINAIFYWQKVLLHRNEFAHQYRLSPVYPNCPVFSCYSIFTSDSSHRPYFTWSLKIPQAVSLFYHRLPKSFSEEYWSREDILFPCPHRVTTFSVGRSGSTRVIHSPVLNITSSTGEECQLFASYPDVTLSPRVSHDKPTLSRFFQNLNMAIKFRESKWQWKKKSRTHLPLAWLWEMPFLYVFPAIQLTGCFLISEEGSSPFPVQRPLREEEGVLQQPTRLWNPNPTWDCTLSLAPVSLSFVSGSLWTITQLGSFWFVVDDDI